MEILIRCLRATSAPALLLLALLVVPAGAAPAAAQSGEDENQNATETQLSRKERKERAKQARIEEYLRKKEERRARREMRRIEKEREAAERADDRAQPGAAAETAVADEAVAKTKKRKGKKAMEDEIVRLPRGLAQAQETVRSNALGQDPTVREYLDLIDRAEATPTQLAAFGNFLAQSGMKRVALEYYAAALSVEQDDPLLWLNVGTLHRQLREFDQARGAYGQALSLDPNNAFAHYNMGAVLDEMGDYDQSIEEYRIALTLDPSLGDPATNPQAANNERLLAVKLMLYDEQTGSLGLPLVDVPGGTVEYADED
jgi:tetratricopeptide (TPR) repeat protein